MSGRCQVTGYPVNGSLEFLSSSYRTLPKLAFVGSLVLAMCLPLNIINQKYVAMINRNSGYSILN